VARASCSSRAETKSVGLARDAVATVGCGRIGGAGAVPEGGAAPTALNFDVDGTVPSRSRFLVLPVLVADDCVGGGAASVVDDCVGCGAASGTGGHGCVNEHGADRGDLPGEGYSTCAICAAGFLGGGVRARFLDAAAGGGGGRAGEHWSSAIGVLRQSPSAGPNLRSARTVAVVTADFVLFSMAMPRSALVFCGRRQMAAEAGRGHSGPCRPRRRRG
jgi:hypothetical protein